MSNRQQLRNQVLHYFQTVGSGENMIQCIKEVLFLHQNFNPVLLFEKLSKGKQRISHKNWKDYLQAINLSFTEREFKYFMKHNEFGTEVTLNQFLQALIPYNGDVVRKYKTKCTLSIRIATQDKEVEYIFAELIQNQFKNIRILINIRDQISTLASLKDIENLVKQDLLNDLQNEPREQKKLKETFEQKGFKLGFSELRKFFKIFVSEKTFVHELCMLNVMRHLKSTDPFCKIIFQKKRAALKRGGKDASVDKKFRPIQGVEEGQQSSPQKSRSKSKVYEQSPYRKHLNNDSQGKYRQFKDQILEQFNQKRKKEQLNQSAKRGQVQNLKRLQEKDNRYQQPAQYDNYLQSSQKKRGQSAVNHQRNQYGVSHPSNLYGDNRRETGVTLMLRFFQEILLKEQKLQKLRKDLAKNQDFNLINLYKLIDVKRKGYVTARDIYDYPEAEKTQYGYMVGFFGRQKDRLLFHEFCQIFRPLARQLNQAIDSRAQNKLPDPFKKSTHSLITQILSLTSQLHLNLQKLRQSMQDSDPKDLFVFLDVSNKGYLDSESFAKVFRQNQIACDDRQMKCLFKMFKRRVDDKIMYLDFVRLLEV